MPCDSPIYVLPKGKPDKVPVPCGKCPPCKLRRVNSWVFRLMQEEKRSTSSHFVTLTYDTRHVPISRNGFKTLDKGDLQKFFKRLRKLVPHLRVKYYAVGEYGSRSARPHYHAIIFNVPSTQMYVDAWTLNGSQIGTVHIGQVTSDSIAYTMKYIDKSNFVKRHNRDDRVAEFPLMSKGLGDNYLTDAIEKYYKADLSRMFITKDSGHKIALPRYYRLKIFDKREMLIQRHLADQATEKRLQRLHHQYVSQYGSDNSFTFVDWLEAQKNGRFYKFYANQKRDVI